MPGIRDYAAGLSRQATSQFTDATSQLGVLGKAVSAVTDQYKEYNEVQKEVAQLSEKIVKEKEKLIKAADASRRAAKALEAAEKKAAESAKKAKELKTKEAEEEAKRDAAAFQRQRKRLQEARKDHRSTASNLAEMRVGHGKATESLKKLGDGMKGFGLKAGFAGIAISLLKNTIFAFNNNTKLAAATMLQFSENLSGAGATDAIAKTMAATASITTEVAKYKNEMKALGATNEQSTQLYMELTKRIRENKGSLVENAKAVMTQAKSLYVLSNVLKTDVNQLMEYSTTLVDRFSMSNEEAANSMAQLHSEVAAVNTVMGAGTLRANDMTAAIIEMSQNTMGAIINTKQLTRTLWNAALAAQEQGASYSQSLQVAKELTELISGKKAPEFARFDAGGDLLRDLRKYGKDVDKIIKDYFPKDLKGEALENVKKRLTTLVEHGAEMGEYSQRMFAQSLFSQTEEGMRLMLNNVMKFGGGSEGIKILQDVYGLSEEVAQTVWGMFKSTDKKERDAAMGAIKAAQEMKIKEEAEKRPATAKDLNEGVGSLISAIKGIEDKGVMGYLMDILEELTNIFGLIQKIAGIGSLLGDKAAEAVIQVRERASEQRTAREFAQKAASQNVTGMAARVAARVVTEDEALTALKTHRDKEVARARKMQGLSEGTKNIGLSADIERDYNKRIENLVAEVAGRSGIGPALELAKKAGFKGTDREITAQITQYTKSDAIRKQGEAREEEWLRLDEEQKKILEEQKKIQDKQLQEFKDFGKTMLISMSNPEYLAQMAARGEIGTTTSERAALAGRGITIKTNPDGDPAASYVVYHNGQPVKVRENTSVGR